MARTYNDNEQWGLNGNCDKCRKQKYCKTRCRAQKVGIEEAVKAVLGSRTALGQLYKRVKEHGGSESYID